jgi:hypothetical protein
MPVTEGFYARTSGCSCTHLDLPVCWYIKSHSDSCMQEVLQLRAEKLVAAEKEVCASINASMAAYELSISPVSAVGDVSPGLAHDHDATRDVVRAFERCQAQPDAAEPKLSAIVAVLRNLQEDFEQLADERNDTVAALAAQKVRRALMNLLAQRAQMRCLGVDIRCGAFKPV